MTDFAPPLRKPLTPRKLAFRTIATVVAVGLLLSVLTQINWDVFATFAARLTPLALLAAFATVVAQNFFRALRYRTLLGMPQLPLRTLFPITLYHNFMVRLIPFKLGELTYIVLMKQHYEVSYQAGVTSLVSSRLLELIVIVMVGLMTLVGVGDVLPIRQTVPVVIILSAMCVVLIALLYTSGWWLRLVMRGLERVLPLALANRLMPLLAKLATELESLRDPRRFFGGLFWSLFTYGSTFATSAIMLNALGIQLAPAQFIEVITLGMFASAVPFNISGFGMVEWSLAFGLTQFTGMPLAQATAIGLLLNGFQQLAALVSGVMGIGLLHLSNRHTGQSAA